MDDGFEARECKPEEGYAPGVWRITGPGFPLGYTIALPEEAGRTPLTLLAMLRRAYEAGRESLAEDMCQLLGATRRTQ